MPSVNVMMADNSGIIRYINKSTEALMRAAESNIAQAVSTVQRRQAHRARASMSSHRNPSHQRNLLANLRGTHKTQIVVGDLIFALSATPMIGAGGERLGAVLEWVGLHRRSCGGETSGGTRCCEPCASNSRWTMARSQR